MKPSLCCPAPLPRIATRATPVASACARAQVDATTSPDRRYHGADDARRMPTPALSEPARPDSRMDSRLDSRSAVSTRPPSAASAPAASAPPSRPASAPTFSIDGPQNVARRMDERTRSTHRSEAQLAAARRQAEERLENQRRAAFVRAGRRRAQPHVRPPPCERTLPYEGVDVSRHHPAFQSPREAFEQQQQALLQPPVRDPARDRRRASCNISEMHDHRHHHHQHHHGSVPHESPF